MAMNTRKRVTLLTSNPDKIRAAQEVFKKYDIEVEKTDLPFEEIQASSSEVAKRIVQEAYEKLKRPVLREDHSFFIGDTGIPGPYMNYFDKKIDVDSLISILNALNLHEGYFELAAAFIDETGKLHEYSYKVPVKLEAEARGDEKQRWERIMRFPDEDKVFAEYPSTERTEVWTKNYEKIAQLIQDQETA